jgi:hypothetical protein
MKITLKIEKEYDVKYIHAKVGVRYWDDAIVNGLNDVDGSMIPCRKGDYWCPIIDVETGHIINWKEGVVADVHYKCCDDGEYYLLDEDKEIITQTEGYVPSSLCPSDGYGDYVIMKIDESGKIEGWDVDLNNFLNE